MKKVAGLFASAKLPAVLCVASGGGIDEDEITFTKVVDSTAGQNITILSNIAEPKSPITGEPVEVSNSNVETASMDAKQTLSAFACIASCVSCEHDTYVVPELASELDAKKIHCSNCGEEVEASYYGDFMADTSADDLEEDESEDITDALDEDMDEEEDESDSEEEEETVEEETTDEEEEESEEEPSEKEEETEEETEETTEEEEEVDGEETASEAPVTETPSTTENVEQTGETTASEETTTESTESETTASETNTNSNAEEEHAPTVAEVTVASVANYEANLQFATMADTSRYQVFLGDDHIGSLFKDEASANVQAVFAKQDVLRNAFGRAFWNNAQEIASGNVDSLADFGFKPAVVAVKLDKVVASQIDEAKNEVEAQVDEATKEAIAAVVASMKVAAAGINKGMLESPVNLYSEVAKMLNKFGVVKAEEASARFVETFSEPFFAAVTAAAENLRTESPEYVRGLAVSIEKASYKPLVSGGEDYLSTSALLPRQPVKEAQPAPRVVETASAAKSLPNPFARIGRR